MNRNRTVRELSDSLFLCENTGVEVKRMGYAESRVKLARRITDAVPVDDETAYTMILMTAALMDLRPDDDAVVDMILEDLSSVGLCQS